MSFVVMLLLLSRIVMNLYALAENEPPAFSRMVGLTKLTMERIYTSLATAARG